MALDRVLRWPDHHGTQAERERQQVAQRDRPSGRYGVVERSFEAPEHAAAGKLGQQIVDRIVEAKLALLHQDQGGRGRDRLGHRGDAEDRVASHRRIGFE
jgi:hypothetical protein